MTHQTYTQKPNHAYLHVEHVVLGFDHKATKSFSEQEACNNILNVELPLQQLTISVKTQLSVDAQVYGVNNDDRFTTLLELRHEHSDKIIGQAVSRLNHLRAFSSSEMVMNVAAEDLISGETYILTLSTDKYAIHGAMTAFRFYKPDEMPQTETLEKAPNWEAFMQANYDTHGSKSAWEQLDAMVGLDNVKESIRKMVALCSWNEKRVKQGSYSIKNSLHAIFLGNPGTGKTTVAKLLGEILKEVGALSKGHVVVKERASLITENYGGAEKMTKQAISESLGGILLIDEAYQLYPPNDPKDPGKEVIGSLMTAMADPKLKDWMVILAGYTKETLALLDLNPGLRSRIAPNNTFDFKDYSCEELMEIAENYLSSCAIKLTSEAREKLIIKIESDLANKDEHFGNARYIISLIENTVVVNLAFRTKDTYDPDVLKTIEACDIPEPSNPEPKPRLGFRI